ncbi:antA/AntB antirepressor family protein [Bacillus sp. REN10]|uniref:antA/AntB antirepressor family protein n=1 Tax=Bacillus sp. REN10 TaxID=2782541 RepID=UPI00193C0238|nr:antA/AntB antirepressor family protein [Bacillus sp. REN10]
MNLKTIANDMLPVYENEYDEKLINARELHEQLLVTTPFHKWIERRIENYGFVKGEDFWTFLSESDGGRPATQFFFLLDAGKEIAMLESNEQGRAIRRYFIEVERRFRQQKPQSVEDLIIMQAQSMKEIRQTVERQGKELETVNHRLDNIDRIDTIGDLQQRLNAMVRKLAQQQGLTFQKAWNEFRTAYNTAYHTNLKAKLNNYKEKHALKSLTIPQYLSLTNQLQDAIRVADKLLNQKERAG